MDTTLPVRSFSQRVKTEICERQDKQACCRLSELYAVLLFAHTFNRREVRIITKSEAFAARLPALFSVLHLETFLEKQNSRDKYVFVLDDKAAIARIFEAFELDYERFLYPTLHANIIEKPCCRLAFLRGAFLSVGFIVDPEKEFRVEFLTTRGHLMRQMRSLFLELDFSPKTTTRGNGHLLYIKDSEAIEKLLSMLGAVNAQMEVVNAKILRSVSNKANRRANCDIANTMKSFANARSQIDAIERIQRQRGLGFLDDKLRRAAELRLLYPDMSLAELCLLAEEPLSKSGLNYRLQKILDIARELPEG